MIPPIATKIGVVWCMAEAEVRETKTNATMNNTAESNSHRKRKMNAKLSILKENKETLKG